jgi:hypothetical protein
VVLVAVALVAPFVRALDALDPPAQAPAPAPDAA